jgi:hypothetical protein
MHAALQPAADAGRLAEIGDAAVTTLPFPKIPILTVANWQKI